MSLHIDTLFLLPPGFADGPQRQYCPECAEIEGVLSYFPQLESHTARVYCALERPREALFDRLGAEHQNCPTLILAAHSPHLDGTGLKESGGFYFYDNARDIGRYWALRFGTAFPRGHG